MGDPAKDGVQVITPNPKTSGGARYNYFAARAYGEKNYGRKDAAKDFVKKVFKNVPVLAASPPPLSSAGLTMY